MGLFVGFIGAFYGLLLWRIDKKIYNPGFLFEIYWASICILSSIHLYGLYNIKNNVYFIIFCGETFFFMGFIFSYFMRSRFSLTKQIKYHKCSLENVNIIFAFLFCALVIIDINVVSLILKGIPFQQIRYQYMDDILKTYFMTVLYRFLVFPLIFSFIIITIVDIICNKKFNTRLFIKAMILTVMEFFALADRMLLMLWIVGFGVAYAYLKDSISKKLKRILCRMLVLGIILVIAVFWLRGVEGIRTTYYYLTGELIFLQNRISDISDYTIITSSTQGILRPIMGIFEKIGIKWHLYELADAFLYENQNQAFEIAMVNGEPIYYNYFISCYGCFYKDLGNVGIVLYTFLWGVVSSYIYKKIRRNDNDAYYLGIFIMIIMSIALGMMNFSLMEVTYSWGIIFYIFFLCEKQNNLRCIKLT